MKATHQTSERTVKTICMKKAALLFILIIAIGAFTNVNAQDVKPTPIDRTLNNGFSIKVTYGIPSSSFGTDSPVESSQEYGVLYGLQLGNQWYINPMEKLGFGIMVNWIDLSGASKSGSGWERETYDLSALELGPIGTYAITKQMAIDVYYNLRPTLILNKVEGSYYWEGEYHHYSDTWQGAAFTHAIGAGFRWRALSAGMEYVFGSVEDDEYFMFGDGSGFGEMQANSFRFLIGVKF